MPVLLLVATLALAGCGGSSGGETTSSGSSSQTKPLDIHVKIANGEVTPAGERVDATVGQPIRMIVDSDAADELHVHSTPEHEFEVPANAHGKVYKFTLQQPGVVEVELHGLDEVVVSIAARP
jgi:hypothetical protein